MGGRYIAFFLTLYAFIAVIGFFGSDLASGESLDALPVLDEDIGLFGTIGYGFELVIYFLGLQGLVLFGIPNFIAGLIALVLDGILIYFLVRLVRGGG